MLNKDSSINAGDKSTNNQAHTINNNTYGLSYKDVKEIANDLFESNFLVLKAEAAAVASERASEITEKFLIKLKEAAPDSINEFATPGMQDTFFNAQKEYAISGDIELADMLVDMLVERAKSPIKNRRRLVLDESLKIAPKLSIQQIDLLSLCQFTFRSKHRAPNFEALIEKLTVDFSLLDKIDTTQINDDLNFLEYLRLGKLMPGKYENLITFYLKNYAIYLTKGFTLEECHVPEIATHEIFIPCFHDKNKFQLRFMEKDQLIEFLKTQNLTEERINHISEFFSYNLIHKTELQELLISRIPNFETVLDIFENSNWSNFELTSVGVAIALSNYERRFGGKLDLSKWVK